MVQISSISNCNNDNEMPKIDNETEKSHESYTLDEAIEKAKIGKYQTILTILTSISVLGVALENTNISYISPYAKCDLNLTVGEQGLLSSISSLGIAFTSHFWGFMADTWGRQKVIRAASIGGFIFAFASAFATNTISMILLRFVVGAFLAGSASSAYSYISEFHTSGTAARAAACMTITLYSMWVVLSPLAMIIIPMDWSFHIFTLDFKPWRLFLLSTSLLSLWNGIVFSFVPETPKFLLAMNHEEETLELLSRIYALNSGQPKENYPVKHIEIVTLGNSLSNAKGIYGFLNLVVKQTKPIFQSPLSTYTWKLSYIIFMVCATAHGALIWFPDILIQLQSYNGPAGTLCETFGPKPVVNGTDQTCNIDNKYLLSFQLLFAVGICFLTISALSSFFLKKIEPKKLVPGWLLLSALACLLINFLPEFYSMVVSYVTFISVLVCSNIIIAITANLFPINYRGMATAFVLMCGRIGSVTGTTVYGYIVDYNCNLIFYMYPLLIISYALVFMSTKLKPQ